MTKTDKEKNNSKNRISIVSLIPSVLIVCMLVICVLSIKHYGEDLKESRIVEHWSHNYATWFRNISLKEGEVVQTFKTSTPDMQEFILEFDDFSPSDTATLKVTLEDSKGNVYYTYECPTSAFGESYPFYLVAKPEEKLPSNGQYEIHISIDSGESDISVRAITREGTHASVKKLTVNGEKRNELVLYMFQQYNREYSYVTIWMTILAVSLFVSLLPALIPSAIPAKIWNYLNIFALTPVIYYLMQKIDQGGLDSVYRKYIYINLLLILAVFMIIKGLIPGISFYVTVAFSVLWAVVNFYVILYKGDSFLLTQLSAFSTTASVIDNYRFEVTPKIMTCIVVAVSFISTQLCADIRLLENRIKAKRSIEITVNAVKEKAGTIAGKTKGKKAILYIANHLPFLAAGLIVFVLIYTNKEVSEFSLFNLDSSIAKEGYLYSNLCVVKLSHYSKPLKYSENEINRIISDIEPAEDMAGDIIPQNIIVIMNESLCDLRIISDFETDEEFMPFIDGLDENTIKGNMYVNTFGGGTSITEYEFLTGNTESFFPAGSNPYASLCKNEESGITKTLKSQGFHTVAMHPYGATNWNRDKVYPAMGFDEFIDGSGYEGYETIREYVSDKGDFQKIIDYVENFDKDERLFIFNVTMQNHGGYDVNHGNIDNPIKIDGVSDYLPAEIYLGLVKESDNAFKYLTDYFSNVSEPTMIVMFGDHNPAFTEEFFLELYDKRGGMNDLEDATCKYTTQYIIWTNYDSDFDEPDTISTNYLGSYVLLCSNLEMTEYDKFLLKQRKKVSAIGKFGIKMPDGTFKGYPDTDNSLLEDYKILQYLRVEDRNKDYYDIFNIQ
ncbi:MAG: LTA synthase family protein [Lachnospiraceae bacterium]|nr:LTA synthase family protein [Lachnospiraceae bacterium]